MSAVTYAFGIIVAILALVAIIELMRRVTLRERHAVWWLVGGIIALIVAIFPQTLTWAAHLLGFAVPTNLAFFLAIGLLFLVSLQYGAELTRVEDRMRSLAEQTAFQEDRLRVVEDQLRAASALSDGAQADAAAAEAPAAPPESTPDASA